MTTRHHVDDAVTVWHGDCIEVLRTLPDCSIDAVVTDPPKSLDVSKAIDKAAGATREVVGRGNGGLHHKASVTNLANWDVDHDAEGHAITAPATPAAQQWQGWGTALKPAHEPVVWARKPLGIQGEWATIGSHLEALEALWRARAAEQTTPTGEAAGSPAPTGTSPSESTASTNWNIVSSWLSYWAETCSPLSTSTTSTMSEMTTDLRTLSSCLSRIMGESTQESPTPALTESSSATAAANLFIAIGHRLRATLALSALASATGTTPPTSLDEDAAPGSRYEPIVVARKPLIGTVAANVLAHGTGALNVDGCRIGYQSEADEASARALAELRAKGRRLCVLGEPGQGDSLAAAISGDSRTGNEPVTTNPAGRWPANVILDESQARALDEMSGVSRDGVAVNRNRGETRPMTVAGTPARVLPVDVGYGGEGGASRFFYTAKADSAERPRVNGVAHPTVKPLDLMRWLVRLVTPRGGTVLEPFAGSGTTAEACIAEGFPCIAIEREPTYLPLILARVTTPTEAVLL